MHGSVANSRKELHRSFRRIVSTSAPRLSDRTTTPTCQRHVRAQKHVQVAAYALHSTSACCRSGPAITHSIVERHVRASSLGATRRPVPGCGLDPRTSRSAVRQGRDGRHEGDGRHGRFNARFGRAASDDHAGDSGGTGVAAMKRSTNRRMSGSICTERPDALRARRRSRPHLVALPIQAKRQTSGRPAGRAYER